MNQPDPHQLFHDLLARCAESGASDLHLSADEVPFVRAHGRLERMDQSALTADQIEQLAHGLMSPRQRDVFAADQTLDLSYALDGGTRFRINVYCERGRVAVAVRRLEQEFRSLADWGLPEQLGELADRKSVV